MSDHYDRYNGMDKLLGTNLAEVGTDCISRQAVIVALRKMQTYKLFSGDDMLLIDQARAQTELMLLPPAQPKMGKWIYHIDDLFPAESTMECNQCHAEQPLICDDEFCPHCGAKMEVTE